MYKFVNGQDMKLRKTFAGLTLALMVTLVATPVGASPHHHHHHRGVTVATGQVQLSNTAQATANTAGAVTITFPAPGLTRTWQGSVSVSGSPPGTPWQIFVGGSLIGVLFAPGPFGPVQALSGQAVTVVADIPLVSGQTYTASLTGVDDPSSDATPYSGPVAVSAASNQGGLQIASVAVGTGSTVNTGLLLANPPAGCAYRIQSVTVYSNLASNTNVRLYLGQSGVPVWTTLALTGGFTGQTFLLNGQLLVQAVVAITQSIGSTAITSGFIFTVTYDLVAIS